MSQTLQASQLLAVPLAPLVGSALAGIFGTEITLPDAVSPVEHLYDHMVSTYPMVWVDCPTYGPVIRKYKMFVDYVNMVDDYQRMQQDAALDQVKELISA